MPDIDNRITVTVQFRLISANIYFLIIMTKLSELRRGCVGACDDAIWNGESQKMNEENK